MSSRRKRASSITEDEINDLVLKLHALLQESNPRGTARVPVPPAWKILEETCRYIKKLQTEVDDLSERLSQLLASADSNGVDADILRSLLQQ